MSFHKLLLPFLFCQFIASAALAQNDFVVTAKGDTILGVVRIIISGKMDRVQLFTYSEKSTYNALQTKAIMIDYEIYQPVPLGDNFHFMKLLRPGFLSLYGYRIENQKTYDGRLLRKENGEYFDVPIIKFRSSLLKFIEDCESSVEAIKVGELGRENLREIIDEYNLCMAEKFRQRHLEELILIAKEIKIDKLDDFKQAMESSTLDNKMEIAGLLNDMLFKIKSDETVPNYQKRALLDFLKGKEEFREKLEELMKLIE